MALHIVLVKPEIPGNTGNIARLCSATGCELHLVRPLGFDIDDRQLKRAGLDYWHLLTVHYYDGLREVQEKYCQHTFWYNTTKTTRIYSDVFFAADDFLVFGCETAGLPAQIIEENFLQTIRIPMRDHPDARSLNLSNAVAVVVYEALRQNGYSGGLL